MSAFYNGFRSYCSSAYLNVGKVFLDLFGGCIKQCATLSEVLHLKLGGLDRQSEVDQFHLAEVVVVSKHHVVRLDVSVDHIRLVVQVDERLQNAPHNSGALIFIQLATGRELAQRLEAQFHLHHEVPLVVDVLFRHRYDVGVLELRKHFVLPLQVDGRVKRFARTVGRDFECLCFLGLFAKHLTHDAEPARAQNAAQSVELVEFLGGTAGSGQLDQV